MKIFGNEMKPGTDCEGWALDLGLFNFDIWSETSMPGGSFYCAALRFRPSSLPITSSHFHNQELARDWLESEARRIAREFVSLADPLVAVSPELLEPAEVRLG